jgi:hypothetical protein
LTNTSTFHFLPDIDDLRAASVISINTHSAKLANAHLPPIMDSVKPSKSGGGFFSSLLKLIFFGAICAVGFVAWKAYVAKKGNPFDAKRF